MTQPPPPPAGPHGWGGGSPEQPWQPEPPTQFLPPQYGQQVGPWQQPPVAFGGLPAPAPARSWFARKRVLIPAGVLALALVGSAIGANTDSATSSAASAASSAATSPAPLSPRVTPPPVSDVVDTSAAPVTTTPAPTTPAPVVTTPAPVVTTPAPPPPPSVSVSQANAVRSAGQYLDFTHFSRSGLIGQLEYEGYSTDDATAAVDSLAVDWNEQAAGSAQSYLEFTSFSHAGLVDQLVYEGYTPEQAEYGVSQTGL